MRLGPLRGPGRARPPGRAIPAKGGEATRESRTPVHAWAALRPPTRQAPCRAVQGSIAIGRSLVLRGGKWLETAAAPSHARTQVPVAALDPLPAPPGAISPRPTIARRLLPASRRPHRKAPADFPDPAPGATNRPAL